MRTTEPDAPSRAALDATFAVVVAASALWFLYELDLSWEQRLAWLEIPFGLILALPILAGIPALRRRHDLVATSLRIAAGVCVDVALFHHHSLPLLACGSLAGALALAWQQMASGDGRPGAFSRPGR